jgi:hypothetical protein
MIPGHFFPLNVARTMRTMSVTRMKIMRNLAMVGQMTEIRGQTTAKTRGMITHKEAKKRSVRH